MKELTLLQDLSSCERRKFGDAEAQKKKLMPTPTVMPREADATPPSLLMMIGIMSHKSAVALGRRQSLRSMLRHDPRVAVRFVMSAATPDEDKASPDILTFEVRESSRVLGTYLLNNAFFRHAVQRRPSVPFIARADDDSFFDVPTVLDELLAVASRGPLVYGPFAEWYLYSPRTMMASCFDFNHRRFANAVGALHRERGDASKLPRFERECLHAGFVGPFPFGARALDPDPNLPGPSMLLIPTNVEC